nr:hypothetical protein [Tanacetum cinerariifolium]
MTRTQTQGEINELIENVNQKTYAYADVLSSTGLRDISSVRQPSHKDSLFKNSILSNTKNSSEKVEVSDRKRRLSDVASKNDDLNKNIAVQIVLWIVNSGCSKHMMGDRSLLKFFVEKFIGIVRFRNDHFAAIKGDDLLTGDRESNLYTIPIFDMAASSLVCLMSKATLIKSWLWHRRQSHLNLGTINDLTKHDLVDGLSKFKYEMDHLCFAYERGKSKKASHPPKVVPSNHSMLELLHMDLCGPMRVASINGKRYILVLVDDYSRFTWVYFLCTKDETPEIIKNFIARVQLNYNAKVSKIRTDNDTEFKNAILKAHYDNLGIMQEFLIARTTKLHTKFLWQPNVEYFHVFGSLCYPTNDQDDLGKMKPKADIGIFIGYSKTSIGFRFYNRRTKKIIETIHVKFDELTVMASEHDSLEPGFRRFINDDSSSESKNIPPKEDLDNLFGPMYEEYFRKRCSDTSINSTAQQVYNQEDSPSTYSIVIEEHEAPPIVTTSKEQTYLIPLNEADESNQEDFVDFDGNTVFVPYNVPNFEEAESSTTGLDPSNIHEFHQI